MADDVSSVDSSLVTPTEIARLAHVTRAAVSNWRRRYPDFPAPASGTGRNAVFAAKDVEAWLSRHHKADEPNTEVLVWQTLRSHYRDDVMRGIADVSEVLLTEKSEVLDSEVWALAREWAARTSTAEVIEGLVERYRSQPIRAGSLSITTPQLARAVRQFAGQVKGTIFDPACGVGSLLLAVADERATALVGQELDSSAARLASSRLELAGQVTVTIATGDSLRNDAWSDLRADLVLCAPPVNVIDWGRGDLLLDARWEFGVPTRAESELAWLQHCYAHVASDGRAIVVMPASAAYRKAGRRIRAELVRRGALTNVVALPGGIAASHGQPMHLWVLRRPADPASAMSAIRMVDLTANDPSGSFEPTAEQVADVSPIDLLDEEVDLTPGRHVAVRCVDHLADYRATVEKLDVTLRQLSQALPPFSAGPGMLDTTLVRIGDLVRAGLATVSEGIAVSTSDHLDTDYLQGFIQSSANIKRATSGSFRADVSGSRIPQMSIEDQQRYGAAFHALDEFERLLSELTTLGGRAVALGREGLTLGALRPRQETPPTETGSAGRTTKH
ncbi:SAM-dependent methyltransferase [Nocardia sp. CA2R105]|uniref:N-6 DNA methylase n=1 Tax=Nocardia coffeae TaxID=2873381 RepID=UPI001CA77C0E|nr:N-6 DNA methylase [Nocardia coffeae]MBY8855410.1 SAM-dependent methyltransferase [Nocardia coffeae]